MRNRFKQWLLSLWKPNNVREVVRKEIQESLNESMIFSSEAEKVAAMDYMESQSKMWG